jgi:hypothetical protein
MSERATELARYIVQRCIDIGLEQTYRMTIQDLLWRLYGTSDATTLATLSAMNSLDDEARDFLATLRANCIVVDGVMSYRFFKRFNTVILFKRAKIDPRGLGWYGGDMSTKEAEFITRQYKQNADYLFRLLVTFGLGLKVL